MNWRCLIFGHKWFKWGGTRVAGGLHRRCERCGYQEFGYESGSQRERWINWAPERKNENE